MHLPSQRHPLKEIHLPPRWERRRPRRAAPASALPMRPAGGSYRVWWSAPPSAKRCTPNDDVAVVRLALEPDSVDDIAKLLPKGGCRQLIHSTSLAPFWVLALQGPQRGAGVRCRIFCVCGFLATAPRSNPICFAATRAELTDPPRSLGTSRPLDWRCPFFTSPIFLPGSLMLSQRRGAKSHPRHG
jgi:hypothetical protein